MHSLKVIVEHMEEDMWEWCIIEYKDIFESVKRDPTRLIITNVSQEQASILNEAVAEIITTPLSIVELVKRESEGNEESVIPDNMRDIKIRFDRICLLDSEAENILSPCDSPLFDWVLLGGILGDVEEFDFDRTKELRKFNFIGRHMDKVQMPTNIACRVSLQILDKGVPMSKLEFVDYPEFQISAKERLVVPFRYLRDQTSEKEGIPLLPPGLLDLLKKENDLNLF